MGIWSAGPVCAHVHNGEYTHNSMIMVICKVCCGVRLAPVNVQMYLVVTGDIHNQFLEFTG